MKKNENIHKKLLKDTDKKIGKPKLCVDCKHHESGYCKKFKMPPSLVNGIEYYFECSYVRFSKKCGELATSFTPK